MKCVFDIPSVVFADGIHDGKAKAEAFGVLCRTVKPVEYPVSVKRVTV